MTGAGGPHGPRVEVHERGDLGARAAAAVGAALRAAVDRSGRATLAVSGGSTPGPMFEALAAAPDVPWSAVHVLQVDERVAPDGHEDRNLTAFRRLLLDHVPVPVDQVHPMPVADRSPEEAAAAYVSTLRDVAAGDPPVLDVVHLGLGDDGHTASLVPGDGALDVRAAPVAATGPYQGRRRVTLTVPVLRAARHQLWLVAGAGKAGAVERMLAHDRSIPAAHVLVDDAVVLLDHAAGASLP